MSLTFYNQRRIQEKLRKASIGAIETDSQTEDVLPVVKDRENILPVNEKQEETKKTAEDEVKVKSKPQTKKGKQNK